MFSKPYIVTKIFAFFGFIRAEYTVFLNGRPHTRYPEISNPAADPLHH